MSQDTKPENSETKEVKAQEKSQKFSQTLKTSMQGYDPGKDELNQETILKDEPMLPERVNDHEKTTGKLIVGGKEEELISGWEGPAKEMPKGSKGFDLVTKSHVEGHAAALMHKKSLSTGDLYINNNPCVSCERNLPRMLPPKSSLHIIGLNGYKETFVGQSEDE